MSAVTVGQVWEVRTCGADAWSRAKVEDIGGSTIRLSYEEQPKSLRADVFVMLSEPTRFASFRAEQHRKKVIYVVNSAAVTTFRFK
jgi:hypothetical protein